MASAFVFDRRSPISSSVDRGRPNTTARTRRRKRPPGVGVDVRGGLAWRRAGRPGVAEIRRVGPFDADAAVTWLAALEGSPPADHQARPDAESVGQAGRQTGCPHHRLDGFDVVGDPAPGRRPGGRVEDQVAGPRVAIARLADTAGVQQGPALAERDRVAGPWRERAHPSVDHRERDRDMGVAVEAVLGGDRRQAGPSERGRRDVLPGRITRAAVDQCEVHLHPALRQGSQPRSRRLRDRPPGSTPWPSVRPG